MEERIPNIGIQRTPFFFSVLVIFCVFNIFGFGVFANQPTVHIGGVSRVRAHGFFALVTDVR